MARRGAVGVELLDEGGNAVETADVAQAGTELYSEVGAIEVAVEIEDIDFENGLVEAKRGLSAEVGHAPETGGAVGEGYPHGIDTVGGPYFGCVGKGDVGRGETKLAAKLAAFLDGAPHAVRTAEHGGSAVGLPLLKGFADAGRTHLAAIVKDGTVVIEGYSVLFRNKGEAVEVVVAAAAEHVVEAEHERLGMEFFDKNLLEETASGECGQLGGELNFDDHGNTAVGKEAVAFIVGGDAEMGGDVEGEHLAGMAVESDHDGGETTAGSDIAKEGEDMAVADMYTVEHANGDCRVADG